MIAATSLLLYALVSADLFLLVLGQMFDPAGFLDGFIGFLMLGQILSF